jgi:hypothetical protein
MSFGWDLSSVYRHQLSGCCRLRFLQTYDSKNEPLTQQVPSTHVTEPLLKVLSSLGDSWEGTRHFLL